MEMKNKLIVVGTALVVSAILSIFFFNVTSEKIMETDQVKLAKIFNVPFEMAAVEYEVVTLPEGGDFSFGRTDYIAVVGVITASAEVVDRTLGKGAKITNLPIVPAGSFSRSWLPSKFRETISALASAGKVEKKSLLNIDTLRPVRPYVDGFVSIDSDKVYFYILLVAPSRQN